MGFVDMFVPAYTAVSMCFQYYLFYMIIWISPKEMEEYRYFIFKLTVSELPFKMYYSLIAVVLGPPASPDHRIWADARFRRVLPPLGLHSAGLLQSAQRASSAIERNSFPIAYRKY